MQPSRSLPIIGSRVTIVFRLCGNALRLTINVLMPIRSLTTMRQRVVSTQGVRMINATRRLVVLLRYLSSLLRRLFPVRLIARGLDRKCQVKHVTIRLNLVSIRPNARSTSLSTLKVCENLCRHTTSLPIIPVSVIQPFRHGTINVNVRNVLSN